MTSSSTLLVFLDFDLTLTENHSHGFPLDNSSTLFNSIKTKTDIMNMLRNINSKCILYIVSQGDEKQIKKYFEQHKLFLNVFGSSQNNPMKSTTISWSNIKTNFMLEMIKKYKPKYHLFLDDDYKNVLEAYNTGIMALMATAGNPIENLTYVTKWINL